MRKPGTMLFALLVVLASSAAATTTATTTATAAIPEMPELLQVKEGSKLEGQGEKIKFTTLKNTLLDCAKSKGTGEVMTRLTGTLDMNIEGCKESALKTECLSTGMPKEVILAPLSWRLIYDTKPEESLTLGAGIIFKLIEQIHITCPVVKILLLVKGEVLGLVKPTNQLVKGLEFELKQQAGENLEKVYWELEKGVFIEKKLPEPLMSLSSTGKEFETAAEEGVGRNVTTPGQEVLVDA